MEWAAFFLSLFNFVMFLVLFWNNFKMNEDIAWLYRHKKQ